jgi:hypothetical protein
LGESTALVRLKQARQALSQQGLNEYAPGQGGGGSGDYFQALASAWYNGTFDSGSLQKGIKSQQDVERLLNRGIIGPDGVTRKYGIDYNSTFDGVVISSDDYYEHSDYNDQGQEVDSRNGRPWGPYDYMEFSDDDLSESVSEGNPYDLPGIDYPRPGDAPRRPRPQASTAPRRHPDDPDFMDPDQRRLRADQARVAKANAERRAKKEQGVAEGSLNELAPGAGDEGGGEDPYGRPRPKHYNRSIDFFGQFEADHFDREDFDDATGVFKGYWGNDQIAYFKFDKPQRNGSDDPGMGWYYEPQTDSRGDNISDKSSIDNANERKQQELSMINTFLKSGNRPNPNSQIGRLMKKHGLAEGLMKEPTTRKEYLDQRDKLFRMMAVDSNPANKQIIKQALQDLEARYGNLKNTVKEESSTASEAVERAILNRIMVAHTDLLMKFGPDKVMQAAEEVAYNVGDVDEIGTSDVSAYVNQVKQILGA